MESRFEMGMQEWQRTMSSCRKPSKGLDNSSMGPKGSAELFHSYSGQVCHETYL